MTRSDRDVVAEVRRLSRAVVLLCDGYDVTVASLAVLYAALALRMGTGAQREQAIEQVRSELEDMKDPTTGGAS